MIRRQPRSRASRAMALASPRVLGGSGKAERTSNGRLAASRSSGAAASARTTTSVGAAPPAASSTAFRRRLGRSPSSETTASKTCAAATARTYPSRRVRTHLRGSMLHPRIRRPIRTQGRLPPLPRHALTSGRSAALFVARGIHQMRSPSRFGEGPFSSCDASGQARTASLVLGNNFEHRVPVGRCRRISRAGLYMGDNQAATLWRELEEPLENPAHDRRLGAKPDSASALKAWRNALTSCSRRSALCSRVSYGRGSTFPRRPAPGAVRGCA